MNLDHLRYFIIASKTQHIAQAAAQANVSPSAISHSLRKLEAQLGGRLFQKSGKNIYLTDFGKRFAQQSALLLSQADGLLHQFRNPSLPLNGAIKIAATHGLSNHFVIPALGKLQAKHPGLFFEMYSLRSAEIIEQVSRGELDVGICFSPMPHPNIAVLSSRSEPLMICVRKNHPALTLRGQKTIRALSELPCASPKAFSGVEICEDHPALKKLGIVSNIALSFDSYDVAANYLRATDAWCLMPESFSRIHNLSTLNVPGLEAMASISIIIPKGRTLPFAIKDALCSLT